jgi:hypothetical protein
MSSEALQARIEDVTLDLIELPAFCCKNRSSDRFEEISRPSWPH